MNKVNAYKNVKNSIIELLEIIDCQTEKAFQFAGEEPTDEVLELSLESNEMGAVLIDVDIKIAKFEGK